MKYLININEVYNKEHNEEIFKPVMRWDLIQDLKDMSLEYLDKNNRLELNISYRSKVRLINIITILFSHDEYRDMWNPIPEYCAKFPNPNRLVYIISIDKPRIKNGEWTGWWDKDVDATSEILERIIGMYPEMIKKIM